jgi:hypothetical protein
VSAVLLQIAGEEVARLLGVDILVPSTRNALDAQRRGIDAAAERTGAAPVVDDQAGESV